MPRPGPRRPLVAVRMTEDEIAALDRIAERQDATRSDVVREAVRDYLKRHAHRS